MLIYFILFIAAVCFFAATINLYWHNYHQPMDVHIANHITGGAHLIALVILLHALYTHQ